MRRTVLGFARVQWTGAHVETCSSGMEKKLMITVREYRRLLKVTVKASECMTHSNERSQSMPSGPRCKSLCALIAILYLRLVKSRRYHGIILRVFIFFFFFFARERRTMRPVLFSHCRFECGFYSFLSRWHDSINLEYAPCVWMCKFERALI